MAPAGSLVVLVQCRVEWFGVRSSILSLCAGNSQISSHIVFWLFLCLILLNMILQWHLDRTFSNVALTFTDLWMNWLDFAGPMSKFMVMVTSHSCVYIRNTQRQYCLYMSRAFGHNSFLFFFYFLLGCRWRGRIPKPGPTERRLCWLCTRGLWRCHPAPPRRSIETW